MTAPHCSPPSLIGGESLQAARRAKQHGAKVDWLTFTFRPDPEIAADMEILDFLRAKLAKDVQAVSAPGMFGYEQGLRFYRTVDGTDVHLGRFDWGGNHHMGRARFDLSGTGCAMVSSWADWQAYIAHECFDLKLTRVGLAVDLLDGQYTVEDARSWYIEGAFNAGGRRPKHSLVGAWCCDEDGIEIEPGEGRTFLVGKRGNGKMLRAYEKGRQLGDVDSKWTRFEVELRNIDRDLPLDLLTRPDEYFVGAYKALEALLPVAGEKVATHRKEGEISLAKLVYHAREAYGKTIHVMRLHMSAADIVSSLSVNGVPTRLERAAVFGALPVSRAPTFGDRYEDETDRL